MQAGQPTDPPGRVRVDPWEWWVGSVLTKMSVGSGRPELGGSTRMPNFMENLYKNEKQQLKVV